MKNSHFSIPERNRDKTSFTRAWSPQKPNAEFIQFTTDTETNSASFQSANMENIEDAQDELLDHICQRPEYHWNKGKNTTLETAEGNEKMEKLYDDAKKRVEKLLSHLQKP